MKRIFIFLIFFNTYSGHVIIIIPGTWALSAQWYKPDGDFFKVIKNSALKDPVVAFNWSCKSSYIARDIAAAQLVTVLESYSNDTEFTIVAHSHGGNVGIIASKVLQRQCIRAFYALGTPVSNESYYPNMDVIKKFFNLFSWEDLIQPLVGYKRIYNEHNRIWNISVKINGKDPQHSDLHHELVAKWLFYVDKVFEINKDWCVNFKSQDFDFYVEKDRKRLLEIDEEIIFNIPNWLRRNRPKSIKPHMHCFKSKFLCG